MEPYISQPTSSGQQAPMQGPIAYGPFPVAPLPKPSGGKAVITSKIGNRTMDVIQANSLGISKSVQDQAQNIQNTAEYKAGQKANEDAANAQVKTEADKTQALKDATLAVQGNVTVPTEIKPPNYEEQIKDIQAKSDQAYKTFSDSVSRIQQGTFPLTSAQQGLLNSVTQRFNSLIESQKQSNIAHTGGITQLQLNRGVQGTETALNNIRASVDEGISKIGEIEGQMSQSLAQLEQGFQKDDYEMVKNSYDAYQKYADKKQETIQKIHDDVQAAEKDARDFNFKQTQANLDNQFNHEKFDYQKGQDVIDNAFKSQQIDLEQKKFLETKLNNQRDFDLNLRKFSHQLEQDAGAGDFGSLNVAAQEYASTGKMPTWVTKEDAAKIAILAKTVKQPPGKLVDAITGLPNNSVPAAQQTAIIALNDALRNLDTMEKAFGEFHQGLFGKFGNLAPSDARNLYNDIKSEFIAKLLQARSGAAITPAEYDRYVDKLPGDWNQTLGLGESGAQKLSNLKASLQGALDSNISINGLRITDSATANQTSEQSLKSYYDASPENAAKVDKLLTDNPDLTAEDVNQILGQ